MIYDELVHGRVVPASRDGFLRVLRGLSERGAQGVILGCTEITLLLQPESVPLPCFDTTTLHKGGSGLRTGVSRLAQRALSIAFTRV